MDDNDDYYRSSSGPEQIVLPTAPRAARGPDISEDRIPKEPPYTAYVANLPYDIDEKDIMQFFSRLKVLLTTMCDDYELAQQQQLL